MLSQQELNEEMVSASKRAASKARAAGIFKERELVSRPVRRLLSGAIERFAASIKEWVDGAAKRSGPLHSSVVLLRGSNSEIIAALAGSVIMNSISSHKPMTGLCVKIGEMIEDELRMKRYRKVKKGVAVSTIRRLNKTKKGYDFRKKCARLMMKRDGVRLGYWSKTQRLHVGVVLLNLFMQSTGLVKIYKRHDSKKKCTNVIVATDECLRWINNYMEAKEVLLPRFMPMVETPVAWEKGNFIGGGYGADVFAYPLVKCRSKNQSAVLKNVDMPLVYKCANRLQESAWRINKWIYGVMRDFWDRALDDGGAIPFNHVVPLPARPSNTVSGKDKAWSAYNKQAAYAYTMNVRLKAKRIAIGQTIYTAQKMLEADRFYFPVQFDFRGRCYYLPLHLNPQGSDYARALLEFADAEPLTPDGKRWLQIFGSNLFGYDKVSHNERVAWVERNFSKIAACAQDPYRSKWWHEAKEKWQFLRWCREYYLAMENPEHPVALPVTMDCTSSGLQVLALLSRDAQSAAMTNLVCSDQIQDVYETVKNRFVEELGKSGEHKVAHLWLQLKPNRSLTKPSVMTIPYGGTRYSIQKNAEEWIREQTTKLKIQYSNEQVWGMTCYYAKTIDSIVKELLPRPVECMDWLYQIAKDFSKENRPLSWTTPSGFFVSQPYMKTKAKSVKTSLAGSFRFFTLLEDSTSKVDQEKQYSTVGPNYIHSMDASIVHKTFSQFLFSSVAIHDCYGCHPNHVEELLQLVKKVFVDVFSNNNLDSFLDDISKPNTGMSVSTRFKTGDFDPCSVLKATYTFG